MPILNDSQINQAAELYASGISLSEVGKLFGCNGAMIRWACKKVGVPMRTQKAAMREFFNSDRFVSKLTTEQESDIVLLYDGGNSIKQIAKKFGCDASVIKAVVVAAGLPILSAAERNRIRCAGKQGNNYILVPDDVCVEVVNMYQSGISQEVISKTFAQYGMNKRKIKKILNNFGTPERDMQSVYALIDNVKRAEKIAVTVEANGTQRIGAYEPELLAEIRSRGHEAMPQKACGSKNIDIAVGPIAVEIIRSHWYPLYNGGCRKRLKYVIERGWWVLIVFVRDGPIRPINISGIADQVITLYEAAKSNPPALRQHWMVSAPGNFLTAFDDSLNECAAVVTPVNPFDVRTFDDAITS